MALWGISTTGETATNNYAIPKYTSGSTTFDGVDINNSPHNFFADNRGWVYRHYNDGKYSGLSTAYMDEVHVPVAGLNTAGVPSDLGSTGLALATPVAVFFADPSNANPISIVGGGATNFISTATSGEIHLCFNESVYASVGATMQVRVFDGNNLNEQASIVATAGSVAHGVSIPVYTNTSGQEVITSFPGQISNRIAFTFTSPSTLQTADITFLTTTTTAGNTVAAGATIIPVDALIQSTEDLPGSGKKPVAIGDSISASPLANAEIVSIGTTTVTISTGSTSASAVAAGTAVTFTQRTSRTNLHIDMSQGFTGIITDMGQATGVTSSFNQDIIRQIGGAGSLDNTTSDTFPLGVGTTILSVRA